MVDKQSNDRQILELTQYCKEHNYKIVKTISSSISGTKTYKDRPDIQELLNSSKLYSKVLITETSRLGRCSKDIQATIASLHKQKIAIIFKNLGGLESLDENGQESFVTNIIISIYAELAQEERRILSERVRSGLVNARHKGKQLGRPFNTKEDRKTILKKYSKLATSLKNGYTLSQCQAIHKMVANNKYLYNRKADRGINLIAIGINDYIGVMGSIQTKQQYISSPGLTIKLAITAHY